MEGKANFIIMLAIVAFLSLALASLTIYVFFMGGGSSNKTTTVEVKQTIALPKDEELEREKLFEDKKVFNLKPDVNNKSTMFQIGGAELVYFKVVTGLKLPGEKIKTYLSEIRALVSSYFMSVDPAEIRTNEGREKIKNDLVKRINDLLKANETTKNDIIYDIVIEDWFYQ